MTFYILLLIQLLVLFGNKYGFSEKSEKICYNNSAGVVHETCCLHFELIDNICKDRITSGKIHTLLCRRDPSYERIVFHDHITESNSLECKVGHYRIPKAKKCEQCPPNLYGKKCASVCNCEENERCDSVNGTCIPWTSTLGTFNYYSTIMQYQHQSTGENEKRLGANHTKSKGSTNEGILIYMIFAGLIILVLCGVAVVYKYQNKQINLPQCFLKHGVTDSTPPPIIARSMQPSVFIEFDNSGGAYELIDDNNILNLEN